MKKFKVYITRNIMPLAVELLKSNNIEVIVHPGNLPPTRDELIKNIKDVDAMISMVTDTIDETIMACSSKLKIIANYAVGYNNIDINAAKRHNIIVTNTPDVLTQATAELAVALIMNTAKKIPSSMRAIKKDAWKTWEPMGHLGMQIENKTLGIIGAGRIGQKVAEMMKNAFNVNIIYFGPSRKFNFEKTLSAKFCQLDELFKTSDIISIHCPLNNITNGLVDRKLLLQMKNGSLLINTARGEIINTCDLIEACEQRNIHVGLDVTDPEPISSDHELLKFNNVTITPHIGSATRETRMAMALCASNNIIEVLNDRPAISSVIHIK